MKRITTIGLLLILSFQALTAQAPHTIKGHIVDQYGQAVISASIQDLETKKGTVTNSDGHFTFQVNKEQVTISVSALGYITKELHIQTTPSDTIKITLHHTSITINQVVCTGTIKPTPIDSSIYKVKLISSEQIEQSGAINLAELLTTEANIRMSTDLILGAQIEMGGLSGQNVKIMIDGIPIIGRLDGNVDLSQINLDNIAQVEVVEGPMSVVYGNNALAGTINLISKKNKYHKLQSEIKAYTESVSRYSGNGNISVKHANHTISANGGYEYFGGVDFDPTTRSIDWKPKTLYRTNLAYNLKKNNWNHHIKAGYYSDKLKYQNDLQDIYKAFDTHYFTQRFDISAGTSATFNNKNNLNIIASYNYYDRAEQEIYTDMRTLQTIKQEKESSQSATQKLLRAIYAHTLTPKLYIQTGLDFNIETMSGPRITNQKQDISDYASFINLHYSPVKSFKIQPGLRYAYNTDYTAPLVYSLNIKYKLIKNISWRASLAKGYRAPSIKELYYEFVDSNHQIYGNHKLNAESSHNINTTIEYNINNNNHCLNITASAYYNNIKQMITLIQQENSTTYTYDNIDKYKTQASNIDLTYKYNYTLQTHVGYGITGRYNSYTTNRDNKYNTTHDWFAGLKFTDPLINLKWSLHYKHNGKLPFFYTDEQDNTIKEGFQDTYHTLNASISRTFTRKCNITAGAKNLFNVTSVNQSATSTSATHSTSSQTPISYGRSYFLSLSYKLYK